MNGIRAIIIGCLGAFAFVASAHAADPPRSWRRLPPEPEYERPEPQRYKELLSGWYLRGDVDARWYSGGPSAATITSEKYTSGVAGTVGFGFKYQWFRADLTYDRGSPTRVSATTSAAAAQPQYGAHITPQSLLANAYIDFGTWAGFTPYVGGGVGISRLRSVNFSDTNPPVPPSTVAAQGTSQNFAWAAMAGVAFQVTPNWIVDAGFRYLHLGDVPSGSAGATSSSLVFKDLSVREARIGIRYLLD
jgi:opacity protein-like surface antigen